MMPAKIKKKKERGDKQLGLINQSLDRYVKLPVFHTMNNNSPMFNNREFSNISPTRGSPNGKYVNSILELTNGLGEMKGPNVRHLKNKSMIMKHKDANNKLPKLKTEKK
jgi:hypothetical protein